MGFATVIAESKAKKPELIDCGMVLAYLNLMNTYTLQFESSDQLFAFQKLTSAASNDINLETLTLNSRLSDREVELATSAYEASILFSIVS